jgi:predicted DNA-binding protein with PD1-like motif
MKILFDSNEKTILVLDRGEEFLSAIGALVKERDKSCTFSMIGGASSVDLAFFDMIKKEYTTQTFLHGFSQNIEIVNVTGNVAWFEGSPLVHAHGIFSNEEYKTFGGHIIKIDISITAETVIEWLPEKLMRKFDQELCLKLLTN